MVAHLDRLARAASARAVLAGARAVFPSAIEREYRTRLVRRVRAMAHVLDEEIRDELADDRDDAAPAARADQRIELPPMTPRRADRIQRAVARARAKWARISEPSARSLDSTAKAITNHTARVVDRQLRQLGLPPLSPPPVVPPSGSSTPPAPRSPFTIERISPARTKAEAKLQATWARTNAELIKSIDARYYDEVAKLVRESVAKGQTAPELVAELRSRTGVAEGRARTIARTEVAKLNAQITEGRQRAAGITSYTWVTSNDERVRPAHRALNGKVFAWGSPPPTEGHPGHAVNCRCVAVPKAPDLDDLVFE